MGRGPRRKLDKDVTATGTDAEGHDRQTPCDESKQYLETTIFECVAPQYKLREIVNKPEGIDVNEWVAFHVISFFDHVNMIYGTISEFCTNSSCPDMTGPGNRQYLWQDDRGKRIKSPAPQYVDCALTFIQQTVGDESVFPTKFDRNFPPTFEEKVKKIVRLLFNVLAHIYAGHFREIVLLNLHSHLNCLFSHLVLFNDQFKLVDEKEIESLVDDVYQVNISGFEAARESPMDVDVPRSASGSVSTAGDCK